MLSKRAAPGGMSGVRTGDDYLETPHNRLLVCFPGRMSYKKFLVASAWAASKHLPLDGNLRLAAHRKQGDKTLWLQSNMLSLAYNKHAVDKLIMLNNTI